MFHFSKCADFQRQMHQTTSELQGRVIEVTGLWQDSSSVLICARQQLPPTTKLMEVAFALIFFPEISHCVHLQNCWPQAFPAREVGARSAVVGKKSHQGAHRDTQMGKVQNYACSVCLWRQAELCWFIIHMPVGHCKGI